MIFIQKPHIQAFIFSELHFQFLSSWISKYKSVLVVKISFEIRLQFINKK
ncbi:Uncharacterised protein [Mycobacterium tuberculosis]|nr:Uncharacterised protein [Mycobacterium tuberculosis]